MVMQTFFRWGDDRSLAYYIEKITCLSCFFVRRWSGERELVVRRYQGRKLWHYLLEKNTNHKKIRKSFQEKTTPAAEGIREWVGVGAG